MVTLCEESSLPIPERISKLQGVLTPQSTQVCAPQHLIHPPACGVMGQAGGSGKSGNRNRRNTGCRRVKWETSVHGIYPKFGHDVLATARGVNGGRRKNSLRPTVRKSEIQ